MKNTISTVALLVLTCITAYSPIDARRRHHRRSRGATTASFFAGAAIGASFVRRFNSRPYYYGPAPRLMHRRPVSLQPVVMQPVLARPVVTQRVVTQRIVTQPVFVRPVVSQPVFNYTYPVYTYSPAYVYSTSFYPYQGYYYAS
ncbi:hypothetical protein H0X06_05585 [Candidatus Dependentiae bacterium]|nr:hypothetical protein [Candidatus Dependentiae bacterium]